MHDGDSGYASSDQGSKKQGTRKIGLRNVLILPLTALHIINRQGKDKGSDRPSPDTSEYSFQPPPGEDEGSQGVQPKEVAAMECPEAASRVTSPSDAPEPVPISDEPQVIAHPNNSCWQDRPDGHRRSYLYNTAESSGVNHPIYNNGGPPMDSAAGYTAYDLNGPYYRSSRPHQELPPGEIAYFYNNNQRSDETHIVGLRSSGRAEASDRDIMNVTSNWVLERNYNYGSSDQVVGQMVLDGVRPRRHAGQFIGNENVNGGQMVVGMDF